MRSIKDGKNDSYDRGVYHNRHATRGDYEGGRHTIYAISYGGCAMRTTRGDSRNVNKTY